MIYFVIVCIICIIAAVAYFFVIAWLTYGWFILPNPEPLDDSVFETTVTVIVPIRNEAKNLPVILTHLLQQDYPRDLLKIIFVDDYSDDDGLRYLEDEIAKKKLDHVKVFSLSNNDGFAKKAALSKGISMSESELIITTDADCSMGENWVKTMVRNYKSSGCPILSGPVFIRPKKNLFSKVQSLEFMSLVGSGAGAIAIKNPFLANGANFAFSREVFTSLKGYSAHQAYVSGDDVFLVLMGKQHFRIKFVNDYHAVVFTDCAANFGSFFQQRVRWASKSKGYKDGFAVAISLIVFIFNMLILWCLACGMFLKDFWFLALIMFILKIITDIPLIFHVSKFFRAQKLLWYYLPMQMLYPFYVFIVGVFSLSSKFRWKERNYSQ